MNIEVLNNVQIETEEITISDFAAKLIGRGKRPSFVAIKTRTDAKAKKTDNPYGVIFKESHILGIIGFIYVNSVNSQRIREGSEPDFVPESRKWGERIEGTPLVRHNGTLYIEIKVEKILNNPMYFDSEGRKLDYKEIKPFLPKERGNKERQGVKKEIFLRDYKLESIKEIAMDGVRYKIV